MKDLKDALLEKDLGHLTNYLYDISVFCKKEQKRAKDKLDSDEVAVKFKNTKKLLLQAINELNEVKKIDKEYFKDTYKMKIGMVIDFSKQRNESDYETGLRVGFTLKEVNTGKEIEILTFDSDKNAIINKSKNIHPRDKYINNGIFERIN